jgi:hypothetical protein
MIDKLKHLLLPIDDFIDQIRCNHSLDDVVKPLRKRAPFKPFDYSVNLDIVKHPKVLQAARSFIIRIMTDKENLGYLYFLSNQHLTIPLNVQFNGELAIECNRYEQVVEAINDLAQEFACQNTLTYEITRVELLYFFIRLVNPHMNWITIDYILQCIKGHAHLISAPNRIVTK